MRSIFAILAVEVCRMVRIYAVVSVPLRNIILFTRVVSGSVHWQLRTNTCTNT
jgi:hypothetical protein